MTMGGISGWRARMACQVSSTMVTTRLAASEYPPGMSAEALGQSARPGVRAAAPSAPRAAAPGGVRGALPATVVVPPPPRPAEGKGADNECHQPEQKDQVADRGEQPAGAEDQQRREQREQNQRRER